MPDRYLFDAYALLVLFTNEPGAGEVAAIVGDAKNVVHVSAINVGEVYYVLRGRRGLTAARQAETTIFQQPNLVVVEASWDRIRAAADIKAEGGLSFADAFVASLARELSAPLVTGDPAFAPLEQSGTIRVVWLPRK